jgi:hypothetical protein
MEIMVDRKFADYDEFFSFYLRQHSDSRNRALHAIGTVTGLVFVVVMIATHHAWYALLWPVIVYSFAWTGHFLIEHNKPATFGHPFWSFISDFRMLYLMFTGQLSRRMEAAKGRAA